MFVERKDVKNKNEIGANDFIAAKMIDDSVAVWEPKPGDVLLTLRAGGGSFYSELTYTVPVELKLEGSEVLVVAKDATGDSAFSQEDVVYTVYLSDKPMTATIDPDGNILIGLFRRFEDPDIAGSQMVKDSSITRQGLKKIVVKLYGIITAKTSKRAWLDSQLLEFPLAA